MRKVPFQFTAAARWAGALDYNKLEPSQQQLVDELQTMTLANPSMTGLARPDLRPLPLEEWLTLPNEELLAQARLALQLEAPAPPDPLSPVILPGCAFAACQDNDLILAACLLEVQLHWGLAVELIDDLADFLAFQQRAGGECGYVNPLRPLPVPSSLLSHHYHLPVTHAIAAAQARYHAMLAS